MKAVVVTQHGGPEMLSYQEVPAPTPAEGEVLIKTGATGVNFADILLRQGKYHGGSHPPVIPGLDVAGTVAAVGPGVNGLRVGQRVAAFCSVGGYAEYVVAPSVLTWSLPDDVSTEVGAAFVTIGVTAYNLLTMAGRLVAGESVVVHSATGGVGSTAVQLARLLGAGQVIGTVGDGSKAHLARALGCDHVINYRTDDFPARVKELTEGRGADLILDAIAGEVFGQSLSCLANYGRIVQYGTRTGEPGHVRTDQLHSTNRAVIGYSSGNYRRGRPHALRPAGEKVLQHLQSGELKLVIGGRYPLSEAAEAHRFVEGRQSTGKVLLLP